MALVPTSKAPHQNPGTDWNRAEHDGTVKSGILKQDSICHPLHF
jgi:hypothetical protein